MAEWNYKWVPKEFVDAMERVLEQNKHKGDSYKYMSTGELKTKLEEERQEVDEEFKHPIFGKNAVKELIDESNICMMLFMKLVSVWGNMNDLT